MTLAALAKCAVVRSKFCRRRRWFSSSTLKSAAGTLVTACKRVMEDADQLVKYEKQLQLFTTGLNPASLWWTMVQLHMPAQTQIDVQEFVKGVEMATKLHLKAVNSNEFAQFAAGVTHDTPIVAELRDYCTPRFFDKVREAVADAFRTRKLILEMQDIEINSAVVSSVKYAQLTQTQYEAQVAGLTTLPFFWSTDATIEYMQIQVVTRSFETTKMTVVGEEEGLVLQDNTRTWTFGSKVNDVDEMEWRIMHTVGVNNAAKDLTFALNADTSPADDIVSAKSEQK